jgi:PAS domain S-box-containing protein
MREGLLVLDLQNRVIDINPAALKLFRRSASEMIGQPLQLFLQNQPMIMENFREITNTDTEVGVTIEGEPRYFAVQISPLRDGRDRLNGRLITFHDVTTRKLTEQELARARDEALEASRFKSELLARVSHELRTPLNAILGFTEMLQEGIYGPLAPAQWEPTQKIIESTGFLTRQVNELLDLARLEAGQLYIHEQDMSVREVVQHVHAQMLAWAETKKLHLLSQVADDVPLIIHSDPDRISQILLNLVGNAIKFSEEGIVRQAVSLNNGRLLIQVSDQGEGISPEMQAIIFEPFKQADGSMTRQHAGAGLGLAIVKQITDLMGGTITLESQVGQGSLFTVCLPLGTAVGKEKHDVG